MIDLSNKMCKGPMRDLIVIVVLTMFMLHSLHYFVVFKTSEIDISSQQNLKIVGRTEQIRKPESTSLRGLANNMSAEEMKLKATVTSNPTVIPEIQKSLIPINQITMISLNKPVTSDVRGNLGPPEVVTNENIEDWLKDRWQAAVDMSGRPIPGEHWLEIDLGRDYSRLTRILLDWEDGYSDSWTIKVRNENSPVSEYKTLCTSKNSKLLQKRKRHIEHEVMLPIQSNAQSSEQHQPLDKYRYVRLVIHKPATQWGSSVWRFQIYGA